MKWHHLGLEVKDLKASTAFYQRNFGFHVEQSLELANETIVFLQRGPIRIELIEMTQQVKPENTIHFAWQVDNIYEWVHDLHLKRVYPVEGPIILDNGWRTVFYQGPDQELIELFQD